VVQINRLTFWGGAVRARGWGVTVLRPTVLSDYGVVEKTMTCMEPFSLVGTITPRVFGS